MRLSEAEIKDAILHPEPAIRERAAHYFADSFSQDADVTARLVKAVETYGRADAPRLIWSLSALRQTEQSVAWMIAELNLDRDDVPEGYTSGLSRALVAADPILLIPHERAIREARHFDPELLPALAERLEMQTWDEATCWRELEAFCEAGKNASQVDEVDLDHADRIVEALARFGERCEAKVREILGGDVKDAARSAMTWMEPLAVRLAGRARLESTIPSLVAKLLRDEDDILNEACAQALARIGTPAAVQAVAEAYQGAPEYFYLYAADVLERIHSDSAVATCLDLLGRERRTAAQARLIDSLLTQFAPEGIEAARRLLTGRDLDFELRGLRSRLLETCDFMGERFPEYDEWTAIEKAEKEEHQRRLEELEDDPAGLLEYALEKLTGKSAAEGPGAGSRRKRRPSPEPRIIPPSTRRTGTPGRPEVRTRVGRNDPCPCGSGKKFKKCCGLKST